MSETLCETLQDLTFDARDITDHGEFWAVIPRTDGAFLAVWLDEDGVLRWKPYKSRPAAVRRASDSWGR